MKKDDVNTIIFVATTGSAKQMRMEILAELFDFKLYAVGEHLLRFVAHFTASNVKDPPETFWDKENSQFMDDDIIMEKVLAIANNSVADRDAFLLGLKIKYFLDEGKLVPDDLVELALGQVLEKGVKSIVLDGYPRTLVQTKRLFYVAKNAEKKEGGLRAGLVPGLLVVHLTGDEEDIVKRVTGRRVCQACMKVMHLMYNPPKDGHLCLRCGEEVTGDSVSEQVLRARLDAFNEETLPALEYLRGRGVPVVEICEILDSSAGILTREVVRADIVAKLREHVEDIRDEEEEEEEFVVE